jgi:CheY-like chemotaxis protein
MILVVDDDDDVREVLCDVLQATGLPAIGARNGREALAFLRQVPIPDVCLVLLDLMMPVMSGHEFLAEKQADPRLSAIPVVVMSARWDEAASVTLPFLRKPVDLDVLLSVIRDYCEVGPDEAGLVS